MYKTLLYIAMRSLVSDERYFEAAGVEVRGVEGSPGGNGQVDFDESSVSDNSPLLMLPSVNIHVG